MTDCLCRVVERSAHKFIVDRRKANGLPEVEIDADTDVFSSGLLDSLALTELVLHVERDSGKEIDFLLIAPDAISTLNSLVDAFAQAMIVED